MLSTADMGVWTLRPHKGPSETGPDDQTRASRVGFDPTRVRLKHDHVEGDKIIANGLRPHKGPSETDAIVSVS